MNERMIWLLPIPILLLTALICWVLGRRTPTRRLGIGAALAMLAALICVVLGSRISGLPLDLGSRSWITAFSTLPEPVVRASLSLRIDGLSALFAATALAGGTLGLLYLAQSLGGSLVGYGRLWSALLLMVVGVLLGVLAGDLVLLLFGWVELVFPFRSTPLVLSYLVLAYSALTFAGMARYGPQVWLEHADPFHRLFAVQLKIRFGHRMPIGKEPFELPLDVGASEEASCGTSRQTVADLVGQRAGRRIQRVDPVQVVPFGKGTLQPNVAELATGNIIAMLNLPP